MNGQIGGKGTAMLISVLDVLDKRSPTLKGERRRKMELPAGTHVPQMLVSGPHLMHEIGCSSATQYCRQ